MIDTFHQDLARGIQIEEKILAVIKQKYPLAYRKEGLFKGYDIWIPELQIGVEVKADEKSNYTGNIVVEIEFNGKPSALATTTADYWVWYDGNFTWFKTESIRDCIKNYTPVRFTGKGDSKEKLAYLIPKSELWCYKEYKNYKIR